MANAQEDKQQVGLTQAGEEAIQILMSDGRFASQTDAYRFAISYAIAASLDPADAPPGGYTTKFSALGTLESGSSIRDLIEIHGIGDTSRPFATAEKLAELGVREIARRLEGNESLADILSEASTTANDDASRWPERDRASVPDSGHPDLSPDVVWPAATGQATSPDLGAMPGS
ncbi:MAG: hypothetical protein JO242_22045 [Streptosporangiaceae bacterium]|nr:hypothetical protein [Streptosporangiaceae bacterium]